MTKTERAQKLRELVEIISRYSDVHEVVTDAASRIGDVALSLERLEYFGAESGYHGFPNSLLAHSVASANCHIHEWGANHEISWPDDPDNTPETGDVVLSVSWPTGAYSMDKDYPVKTFSAFFKEIKSVFPPEFSDTHNYNLYYKGENGKRFMQGAQAIWDKHKALVAEEIAQKKIAYLEAAIAQERAKISANK